MALLKIGSLILLLATVAHCDTIEQVVFIQPDGYQLIDASYIEEDVAGLGSAVGLIDMSVFSNIGSPTDWEDITENLLPLNGGILDLGETTLLFEDTLAVGLPGMEDQILAQQNSQGATCQPDAGYGTNFFGWAIQSPAYGEECTEILSTTGAIVNTPEPATIFLLAIGVFCLLAWRGRKREPEPLKRNMNLYGKGVYR